MGMTARQFLLFAGLLLSLATPAVAVAPPRSPRDGHGDPLPPGVVARVGSERWRGLEAFEKQAFSPDGRWLASSNRNKGLFLWEAATGKLRRFRNGRTAGSPDFHHFAFSPDSKSIFSTGWSGKNVWRWEVPSGRLLQTWKGADKQIAALAVGPGGRLLALGEKGGRVRLLDLKTGKPLRPLPPDKLLRTLAFTADGCLVLLRQVGQVGPIEEATWIVQRIDLVTRRQVNHFEIAGVAQHNIELVPDGRHVATFSHRTGVRLWRVATGQPRRVLDLPHDGAYWFRFSSDGRTLLAYRFGILDPARFGNDVWFCDVGSSACYHRVAATAVNESVLLSPNGRVLVGVQRYRLFFQNARSGKPIPIPPGFDAPVKALAFSADGRSLVAVTWDSLSRWNAETGRLLAVPVEVNLPTDDRNLVSPVLAPDGGLLAVFSEGVVAVLDAHTGKRLLELREHRAKVNCVAFSADSRRLASAGEKGEVIVWDLPGGRVRRRFDTRKSARSVCGLLFSGDGRRLITAEDSARLHRWDLTTGKHEIALCAMDSEEAFNRFEPGDWTGTLSPDGRRLFTPIWQGYRTWELGRHKEDWSVVFNPSDFVGPLPMMGGGEPSVDGVLRSSADGRFVVRTAGWVGAFLYETSSGKMLHRFPFGCNEVRFAPTGWKLATSSDDDVCVLIWDLGALFRSLPPSRSGKETLASLWIDLQAADATLAQCSLWRLTIREGMEGFLDRQLPAVKPVPAGRLKRLLAELGSEDFTTRRNAERELAAAGEAALPALEAARAAATDLEVRARLERLLLPLGERTPAWLRQQRAVLALEARDTREARRVLERLARGLEGARLTAEAKSALKRLAQHEKR
jgi:WD40 repeat protein